MPTRSASSSMHSCPIMVESMSARNSFLRRPASGWHTTSTRRPPNALRTSSASRASASLSIVAEAKGTSQAMPGASQRGAPARGRKAAAAPMTLESMLGPLSGAMRVAMQEITCDPRLSRRRSPGVGKELRRGAAPFSLQDRPPAASPLSPSPSRRLWAAWSSTPIPCRSTGTCGSSPPGRRRKRRPASSTACSAMWTRR